MNYTFANHIDRVVDRLVASPWIEFLTCVHPSFSTVLKTKVAFSIITYNTSRRLTHNFTSLVVAFTMTTFVC